MTTFSQDLTITTNSSQSEPRSPVKNPHLSEIRGERTERGHDLGGHGHVGTHPISTTVNMAPM
jgi:hypothetical protein